MARSISNEERGRPLKRMPNLKDPHLLQQHISK